MIAHNSIVCGDCVSIMNTQMEPATVDMVFADPPYNLSGKPLNLVNNTTGGAFYKVNEEWDTFTPKDYVLFTELWIAASKRVLTETGSLYVCCSMHNIGEIITVAKDFSLELKNILTWHKTNAMPSVTRRTFTHATEYVCWFVVGERWKFNYHEVKKVNPVLTRDGRPRQMRDFLDFVDMPVVQGKERLYNGDRALHPAQKPEKLVEIAIRASTDAGDVVLDPFMGSGTTAVVAQRLDRKWLGIEKKSAYVQAANRRLQEAARND